MIFSFFKYYASRLLFIMKLFLVSTVVYLVYNNFNWRQIYVEISRANILFFIVSIVLYLIKVMVDSKRWQYVNAIFNIEHSFALIFKYTIISPIFDLVLPTLQGEDFYRYYSLKKNSQISSSQPFFLSVFFNRLIGLFFILLLLPLSINFYFHNTIVLCVYIVFVLLLLLIYNNLFVNYFKNKFSYNVINRIESVKLIIKNNCYKLYLLFAFVFVSQFIYAFVIYFLVLSISTVSWKINIIYITIPVIYFAAFFPVSIGGLGIKEGIIYWAMLNYGYNSHIASSVSVLHILLILIFIFIGLIVYVIDSIFHKKSILQYYEKYKK